MNVRLNQLRCASGPAVLVGLVSATAMFGVLGARSAASQPAVSSAALSSATVSSSSGRVPLDADLPGPEKSAVPTAREWLSATPVRLSRTSRVGAECAATRVREWLRVRCPVKTFALSLLGGSNEGLSFWIGPEAEGQWGEVQFPIRRGDRRVVQFWASREGDAGGLEPKPSVVLQEQWIEGESAPTITVL